MSRYALKERAIDLISLSCKLRQLFWGHQCIGCWKFGNTVYPAEL